MHGWLRWCGLGSNSLTQLSPRRCAQPSIACSGILRACGLVMLGDEMADGRGYEWMGLSFRARAHQAGVAGETQLVLLNARSAG